MAVNLLGSGNALVSYPDTAATASLNAMSIAVTLRLTANSADRRIVTQWGNNTTFEQCFLLATSATDEIAFILHGPSAYNGKVTTGLNMVNGGLYRIVAKINTPTNAGAIWVNGVSQTIADVLGTASLATTNSSRPIEVGFETDEAADGLDADYAEVALWNFAIPDWMCEAYGKGYSPLFHRSGLIFYAPMHNVTHLNEVKTGAAGTNTNGTNAVHPSMLYPRGALVA